MHQLLPPTYRDVWLEWRDSEQQQQEESRTAANKPRDQFISRLLTRLKQQQNQSQAQESGSKAQVGQGQDGDEDPEESWENLAGLEIGEGGEELEDKSEKRGGRKEGAGALEAARELLMKLKKSSLAHKLQVNTHKHCTITNLETGYVTHAHNKPSISKSIPPLRQNENSFLSSNIDIMSWRLCSATLWWWWLVRRAVEKVLRFLSSCLRSY